MAAGLDEALGTRDCEAAPSATGEVPGTGVGICWISTAATSGDLRTVDGRTTTSVKGESSGTGAEISWIPKEAKGEDLSTGDSCTPEREKKGRKRVPRAVDLGPDRASDLGPDWATECELRHVRSIRTESYRPTEIRNWGLSSAGN